VFPCILTKECYLLPEEGDTKSFLLSNGKQGRSETICMLSADCFRFLSEQLGTMLQLFF